MRDLLLALLHLAVVTAKLCGSGGVRAVMAENLLLKQQLIALLRAEPGPRGWRSSAMPPTASGAWTSMRVDRAPELLGARGHGPVHASPCRRRRASRRRHER